MIYEFNNLTAKHKQNPTVDHARLTFIGWEKETPMLDRNAAEVYSDQPVSDLLSLLGKPSFTPAPDALKEAEDEFAEWSLSQLNESEWARLEKAPYYEQLPHEEQAHLHQITTTMARVLFGEKDVYQLYDDGTEGLVESFEQIIDRGYYGCEEKIVIPPRPFNAGNGMRCFIDESGFIWSVNNEGKSNHPADIKIEGDTILILGAKDDLGPGRAVDEEYTLHGSLYELSRCIEPSLHTDCSED